MNAKWTLLIVVGTTLIVLSSQVMAQPWGGGGRGPGFGRGQGLGRMAQGPGLMRQGMGPGGPQDGRGTWCPLGADPRGRGVWSSQGLGQFGLNGQFARRLGLTDDQVQKIRNIVDKSRSRTMAAIKEVLTEEQTRQLEQMRARAGQVGQGRRGPALQDAPRVGQGRRGPALQDAPRVGQGRRGPALQDAPQVGRGTRPQRGMNRSGAAVEPPAGEQRMNPGRSWNRGVPPIEQMFDDADANKDGALTKEEIKLFRERMGPGPARQR